MLVALQLGLTVGLINHYHRSLLLYIGIDFWKPFAIDWDLIVMEDDELRLEEKKMKLN